MSLLLLVVVATLWVRSHFRADTITYASATSARKVRLLRGELGYRWVDAAHGIEEGEPDRRWSLDSERLGQQTEPASWRSPVEAFDGTWFLGFAYVRQLAPSARVHSWGIVVVPLWFLLLLTALPPAWWLLNRVRTARRARRGLCPGCGYDLRATPGRCPECGEIAAPVAPAAG